MKRLVLASATCLLLLQSVSLGLDEQSKALQERYRKMAAVLKNKVISVDFKDATFEEVMKFFRASTGLNVVVDEEIYQGTAKEEFIVNLNVNDLPAGDVLDLILRFKGISRAFRHGVLLITTLDKAAGKPFMRIYDVRDLTVPIKDFPGVDIELKGDSVGPMTEMFTEEEEPKHYTTDDIVTFIQENAGQDTWDVGGCRVTIFKGVLIVVQTEKVHVEITRLLAHLRSTR